MSRQSNTLASPTSLPDMSAPAKTLPAFPGPPRCTRCSPIENFSRPAPWSPVPPRSPPPRSPPPRKSSRNALRCAAFSTELTSLSADATRSQPTQDLLADKQSTLDFNFNMDGSRVPVNEALTAVDDSAIAFKASPPPTTSCQKVSQPPANPNPDQHQISTAKVGLSANLPLRHAYSFPSANILAQQDHHDSPESNQPATETRPESLQPERTGQWEDDVDYSYSNAAEADCNFNWNQKSVYVDGDLESVRATSRASRHVEEAKSPNDNQPSSGNHESKARPETSRTGRGSPCHEIPPKPTSVRYVRELEECVSPFGRHQSASEFRGYQHWPQTASKPTGKLRVVSDENCADDAFLDKEAYENVELELPMEHYAASERCYSGGSSTFRAVRPALSKYRSNGSMLSSRASTIRTYRSSNSVGSVPDLIYSLNSSRESVTVEKISPTDSVGSVLPPIPQRLASASQSPVEVGGPSAELPPVPSLPQASSPIDEAKKVPSAPPTSQIKSAVTPQATPISHNSVEIPKSKMASIPSRKRSASAVTPGHCLSIRASYSLFPPPQHPKPRPT
jgi:hypothetical protein